MEEREIVDQAVDMFGSVLTRVIIEDVLAACKWNLSDAIDVFVNMAETAHNNGPKLQETNTGQEFNASSSSVSYANASKQPKAFLKMTRQSRTPIRNQPQAVLSLTTQSPQLNIQLNRIVSYHKQGYRTLVVLRGVPGSGKTTLARQIVEVTVGASPINYKAHIFSSDDFFSLNGAYFYDANKITNAHDWNKKAVESSFLQGLSPIIIDNTNTELWEMREYINSGVVNGYFLEIIEPHTPWATNCNQLARKNIHGVPGSKIRRMLEKYQTHNSSDYILKIFSFSYPPDKIPPVFRNAPPFHNFDAMTTSLQVPVSVSNTVTNGDIMHPSQSATEITNMLGHLTCPSAEEPLENHATEKPKNWTEEIEEEKRHQRLLECKKQIEEFEHLEREWETGPEWTEQNETDEDVASTSTLIDPKPQRDFNSRDNSQSRSGSLLRLPSTTENLQASIDWQSMSNSVPAWDHDASPNDEEPTKVVNKSTLGTMVEFGDTDIYDPNVRILYGKPRDINFYYVLPATVKIPLKQMLNKSSTTEEETLINSCKYKDKHFIAFRKLFKQFSAAALKDLFDKCEGDVHWAAELVIADAMNNKIALTCDQEELSDGDDELPDCDCLSAYSVMPSFSVPVTPSAEVKSPFMLEGKKKKNKALSETSIQLKRQIEKTVSISDHHYSNHSLKLRKLKRGEVPQGLPNLTLSRESFAFPSTSTALDDQAVISPSLLEAIDLGSDDDYSDSGDSGETVNVTLGADFINQLNDRFNNNAEIENAQHIIPVVSMPVSILNQLNALWLESLAHQMETQNALTKVLIKEDEEFAKQLAEKEAEIERAGREPEVPDFREIMDMDLALTLYNREVSEWKNKTPTDLASKLSRDKLYNLFPELDKETLSEILLAHDDNFQATVEVLLTSSGMTEVLQENNGVSKFVMKKEIERQLKALEEERLKADEWPLLGCKESEGEPALETVNSYRQVAQQHLEKRKFNLNKAEEYTRRGMTQVASYYASLAEFHKSRFDRANHFAATNLIRVNAATQDNTTLDLHYLFVAEALEALDLFLDHHIQQLASGAAARRELFLITGRGLHSQGGPRIKPAVRKRLHQRGFKSEHVNPGLLKIMVFPEHKLTHQIE